MHVFQVIDSVLRACACTGCEWESHLPVGVRPWSRGHFPGWDSGTWGDQSVHTLVCVRGSGYQELERDCGF